MQSSARAFNIFCFSKIIGALAQFHDKFVPIFNMGNKRVRIRSLGVPLGSKRIKFKRGSEGVSKRNPQSESSPLSLATKGRRV